MSTSQCVGAQDIGRENLTSPTDQPAEQSVLLPFSGKLSVDEKLKLSNGKFKQTIDESFKDKYIAALSQLTATPPFPTPHVMAQFASKAYTDYERRETDAQYETRLALPGGWKLLTTASNTGSNNGYFGAAYWHPEHQHVVIAHRGTVPKKLGPLWTDLQGVLRNKYVGQMESASTFAYKVVGVLRDVNKEKGTNFQVFFTGHSLGGWLAQITTFTTEYLKVEGNTFLKCGNVPQSFHTHTVVFDSPGCKDMLSQMTDKLDVRLDGRSIDLEHLDITSYLSAPNRFNTCNKHVGTVYRIFVDLSDMDWKGKHTALYTLAMHSMDKIVNAFDLETGQVHKDDQGKLKIQVVIDWPISGFRRGEEYKSFFKWAKHLNNYHTEITVENSLPKGYHPIRYQTKNYDKCVTSISIFSQEERQFLEDYRRLCQLPELFKPKEMFTAIGNEQVQKQAETILQGFEIEKETIRCTDVSALQTHIPYVKRLLQLFPQIKENTKSALSPHEIRNNVYQIGTKRYLEKLHQSPLEFKPEALSLRDFLNSDEQKVLHLRMVDGDAWTGLNKVYQVLNKTHVLSEGHYTVLTLQHLLLVNPMVNLNTLMQSTTTPHLLMMACETDQLSDDETKQIFEGLFNTLRQKPSVKVILTTQSGDNTVTFLQDIATETLSNGFVSRNEQLNWSDLTQSSQEQSLENAVNFQGSEISFNQLISPISPVTNFLPLVELFGKKLLDIGKEPVAYSKCNSYDGRYYIDRTFQHKVIIKQDVLTDSRKKKFPDVLASTEQEFKQLYLKNPESNVHWLERDKSGKLYWQQSHGSLEALRKYIDTHISHTYTADDLDKLLEQAQHQRVILISDTAGMGKSTVLTHLSKQIKQKSPAKWVVRIDLNDHTDALEALKKEQIGTEKAIEFVSEKLLELETGLEKELFKQCCEQKQKVDIVIMLDGFDEVSPSYKETVIALLQALRQTAVEQLWVTTRPHLREELEDELQQLSYTLEPFSEENQVECLTKLWSLKDWFTETDSKEKEVKKVKLEIYAEHLIKKLAQSISDKDKEFTGIPLQCRMLAEAFDEEVKTFCQSAESVPELPFSLDLIGLYETFMKRKYDIRFEEKSKWSKTNVGAKVVRTQFLTNIIQDHQMLALKTLFAEEQVALLQINSQCTSTDEDITRTGIVQVSDGGKLHFIHRTFAEYYVAEFSVNRLIKGSNTSQQVQDLFLQKIFLEGDYRVIRAFMDGMLSRSKPSQEVLKQCANLIHDLCRDGVPILNKSAHEGNVHTIGFLLDSLQAGEHTDTVHGLLLARDDDRHTAWQLAAVGEHIEILVKLWDCAKETLTTGELLNKLLLATVQSGQRVWHYASLRGYIQLLEKMWEWGKEKLATEELRNKLLLAKGTRKETAWHMTVEEGTLEVLQKLWTWATEVLTPEQLKNELLLATVEFAEKDWLAEVEHSVNDALSGRYFGKHTAFLQAAWRGETEILQELWECAKNTLTTEELKNEYLLAKDEMGQTAFHVAAVGGKTKVLQKLWEWAKEILTAEELNKELLLAKDKEEQTAWHLAAKESNAEVLEKLWEWAKEKITIEELRDKLFLAKDDCEQTVWHLAAKAGNAEVLEKLWEWAKEKITTEELRDKLFLAKDDCEQTVWHLAAKAGNAEVLEKLWEWAKKKITTEELTDKLFLAKDDRGQTAWHVAAKAGNAEALEKLWEWAKETLTKEELRNKLLLATVKGITKPTAFHIASEEGETEILRKLWKAAKEELNPEELKNKILLAKDTIGQTAFQIAAVWGNTEVLKEIWQWAKDELNTEELTENLLLAKDNAKRTAWHDAAEKGHTEVLQILWEWSKKELTTEDLNNKLLLAKDEKKRTAWHLAAWWGNTDSLGKLWEWAKEELTTEELNSRFLLATNDREQTAWHVAIARGEPEILQKIWECAEEKLNPEQLYNELLLGKFDSETTNWHVAAEQGNVDVLQLLWKWAKEKQTTDDLTEKLLLAKDHKEQTAFHVAVEQDKPEVLEKLWELAKEERTTTHLNKKLLLATDKFGVTAWQSAAIRDQIHLLMQLWEFAKEALTTDELKNELFLAKHLMGRTAWHDAAETDNTEVLEILWGWAEEELTPEELTNKLLLVKDDKEKNAWHVAAMMDKTESLEKLWEWAKEKLTPQELTNNFLLAKDDRKKTAWHVAAEWGNTESLEKIWEWAKAELSTEELNNELLLAKDDREQTAFDVATQRNNTEVLQMLQEWAEQELASDEQNNILL